MNALGYVAEVSTVPIGEILRRYPLAVDYLANMRLAGVDETKTLPEILEDVDEDMLEEFGLDREEVIYHFCAFLEAFSRAKGSDEAISSVTILGGRDKTGRPEMVELTITPGEVVSIVGPTGSGKSRLLEDIECLAQRDTPTARQILINGSVPDADKRFATGGKLVAQLSQNMNFVMDLTVQEFLKMHAKSRMIPDPAAVVEKCFAVANSLAGEKFTLDTKVTQLSGGQSRSLMIADTALLSSSPIILIDELENAGIDRREAVKLLVGNEKIVLMSTHDPLLALRADKRIVIRNGGIAKVIETTAEEEETLHKIEAIDSVLLDIRNQLRGGGIVAKESIPEFQEK
ncbi:MULTISPECIES: ABC transporter ATP-binding protein [unclassified Methanoculleus]|jgi:ABC-type lipoprotein export system ATPase subunit|uniref:ABC transporter ATP-binding protein n=1 Tax=Methanoculleus palmolei TaxID=72612 RepID=A0ABD8A7L6_9EURY|nr:ABC transporter ATP-binding protein [Methanoculleus sp. UBA377]WOX55018.1 ABC transporter ATP-binding protein [Methanoculleus palmolei]